MQCETDTRADLNTPPRLPTNVLCDIFSYLNWKEKTNVSKAITSWKNAVCCVSAWRELVIFDFRTNIDTRDVNDCVSRFGRYIHKIKIIYDWKINKKESDHKQILITISKECECSLRSLSICQGIANELSGTEYVRMVQENKTWTDEVVRSIVTVLRLCSLLKHVSIKQPYIDWDKYRNSNVLSSILKSNVADRITCLELSASAVLKHKGYVKCLAEFSNLQQLVVGISKIDKNTLIRLVENRLNIISLFKENCFSAYPDDYVFPLQNEDVWIEVLQRNPDFKVDLRFKYHMPDTCYIPKTMPLRTLMLEKFSTSSSAVTVSYLAHSFLRTLENLTIATSGKRRRNLSKDEQAEIGNLVHNSNKLRCLRLGMSLYKDILFYIAASGKNHLQELTITHVLGSENNITDIETDISEMLGFAWKIGNHGMDLYKDLDYIPLSD